MDAEMYQGQVGYGVLLEAYRVRLGPCQFDTRKGVADVPPLAQTFIMAGRRYSFMVAVPSVTRLGNCRFGGLVGR